MTLDVVGSSGVPLTRFIYVTNPFYLVLNPAILQFLTAGVLVPKIVQETIRFSGFSCVLGEGAKMGPATRQATLAAMARR